MVKWECVRAKNPYTLTREKKSHLLLLSFFSETYCPAATHLEDIKKNEPKVNRFLKAHEEWIKKLERFSGEDYSSWWDVGYLWDTLYTERLYFGADHFVAPDWLAKVGNDTWNELYRFNEMEIGCFSNSPQYQRLRAGPFLTEIIDNMNRSRTITESNDRRVFTYASHDTQISYIVRM